jgi:hypothetical protein
MHPDSEAPGSEPNLELPKLGFGRKKKRGERSADTTAEAAETPEVVEDDVTTPPQAVSATPSQPAAPRAPVAPPAPARAPGSGPTPARPPARPAARPPARPATATPPPSVSPAAAATPPAPPRPAPAKPAPPGPPAPVEVPTEVPAPDEATVVFEPDAGTDPLDQAAASLDSRRVRSSSRREARSASRARRREAKESRRRTAPAEALVARLPAINPLLAAIITGVLSGLAAVGLAFGAARGCESVRGTDTCGGGLGLLAIVAILALEVVIGANLLKAWQISDPFSTSFLGVGIVATIAMLTFLSQLDSPWMLLVIPVMTATAFALSWWVTVRFIDEYEPRTPSAQEEEEPVE